LQVYLGDKKYFVASDVGDNTQQWYAFHLVPPGGKDEVGPKETLVDLFKVMFPESP
jgi:hypothetical protein